MRIGKCADRNKYGNVTHFGQFKNYFGTPKPEIWGNQLSDVFESIVNGLSGLINGSIGTIIRILALLVVKILLILNNFGTPRSKIVVTNYWKCLKPF